MNVLLSIKPKYAEAILNGNKLYEFRKVIFKKKNIEKVFIYSSSPVKKIVGQFQIGEVIEDHPNSLWNNFKEFSGLNEKEFYSYFNGNKKGFAIKIKQPKWFVTPFSPKDQYPNFIPPQSFYYLEKSLIPEELKNK